MLTIYNSQGQERYFNTIQAWQINLVTQAPQQHQPAQAGPTSSAKEITNGGDEDELPF